MKVVYCIVGTYNSGGMERVLANKANYLAKAGHELIVITTDQKNRHPYFELDTRIRQIDLGINYTESRSGIFMKVLSYLTKQRQHKRKLTDLLKVIKPDITISMFDHDASFLYQVNDGSRKILEIHFSRFKRLQYGRKGLWKFIDQYRSREDLHLAAKYDHFVVLTEEDKSYWTNLPNIEVIPNANSFMPDSSADLTIKQVVAVGRLDQQKAFDELIYAWVQVYGKFGDWVLKIYGEGPLKKELQTLILSLGLQDVITICGSVKTIQNAYLNSSILAMTSRYEGLPMALLEAQACGLPLVSYACKCGPADIIKDGYNGFLIAEGDRDELARKLIALMGDLNLRQSMAGHSINFSKQYTIDVIMQKWLLLFSRSLNHKS